MAGAKQAINQSIDDNTNKTQNPSSQSNPSFLMTTLCRYGLVVLEDPEEGEGARADLLQICHPDKKANRAGLNGMVFAKVVRGMDTPQIFSSGVEDWRSTKRFHFLSNVVVHAELPAEEAEEEL